MGSLPHVKQGYVNVRLNVRTVGVNASATIYEGRLRGLVSPRRRAWYR